MAGDEIVARQTQQRAGFRFVDRRRFDDDLNSRILDPALTVSMRAERAFGPGLTGWIEALNLTDAEVQTARTATGVASLGPPRTLWIGLSRRW
jgi:hypothetical protein